jgi:hypothetical protein
VLFCGFAVLVSAGNALAILYIHRTTLMTGKGLGSFVLLWFLLYFSVSLVFWFVGRHLERRKYLSWIYWVSVLVMLVIIAVVPIRFYID